MRMQLYTAVLALLTAACGTSPHQSTPTGEVEDSNIADEPFWEVNKPVDPSLSRSHSLYQYFAAAQAKKLPTNFFRDIIEARASIGLRYADWPRYQPGGSRSGTIYHPMIGRPFSEWKALDWSSFYNELYHAWWGTVFTSASKYAADRTALLTAERRGHYRRAHPRDPLLAQEEAYSETVASLALYFYPKYNPHSESRTGWFIRDFYEYNTGKTVAAVGHGERPGFTKEAESTYPNCAEYRVLFRQITDHLPPDC